MAERGAGAGCVAYAREAIDRATTSARASRASRFAPLCMPDVAPHVLLARLRAWYVRPHRSAAHGGDLRRKLATSSGNWRQSPSVGSPPWK